VEAVGGAERSRPGVHLGVRSRAEQPVFSGRWRV